MPSEIMLMSLGVEDISRVPGDVSLWIYGVVSLGVTSVVAFGVHGKVALWVTSDVALGITGAFYYLLPGVVSLGYSIFCSQ